MMDKGAFTSSSFDAKEWINQTCSGAPDKDNLDKYLQEVEMKLQIAAEDTEKQVYDTSVFISSRVHGITRDISRLYSNLSGMTSAVDSLSAKVSTDERQCSTAAARLKQLDVVKSRMVAARKTLQEAATLRSLYDSLDDLMSRGDMQQMLVALKTMRTSLNSLVDVPEFVGITDKVAILESRVKEMAAPKLSEAIRDKNKEEVQKQWEALVAIEKADIAQETYLRYVCLTLNSDFQEILSIKEAAEDWIPKWHQKLLNFASRESEWLKRTLPSQYPAILLQALSVSLKGFVKPVLDSLELPEGNARLLLKSVSQLVSQTTELSTQLQALFPETEASVMASLSHPLIQPFERFINRYAQLEDAVVNEELGNLVGGGTDIGDKVVDLENMIPIAGEIERIAEAAMDRCEAHTANLHLPELLPMIDAAVARAIGRMQEQVREVAKRASATVADSALASVSPEGELRQLLRLPLATEAISEAVRKVNTMARDRTASLAPLAAAASSGDSSLMEAEVRKVIPDQRAAVVTWQLTEGTMSVNRLLRSQTSSSELLPKSVSGSTALSSVADAALLGVLVKPCKDALSEISGLSGTWAAAGSATELALAAPYPSSFATAVGDYLITVPQLLEVLVPEDQTPRRTEDTLATKWLDNVVSNIAEELSSRVMSITKLGTKGSLQLATDLEYMCNIITALGVVLPPVLGTACTLCSVATERDFQEMALAGIADGSLHSETCKALASMRGMQLIIAD